MGADMSDELVVEIGGLEFARYNGEWRFWCGCGDLVNLEDVVNDHCPNCEAATGE
jgi:hypothetical protein